MHGINRPLLAPSTANRLADDWELLVALAAIL